VKDVDQKTAVKSETCLLWRAPLVSRGIVVRVLYCRRKDDDDDIESRYKARVTGFLVEEVVVGTPLVSFPSKLGGSRGAKIKA